MSLDSFKTAATSVRSSASSASQFFSRISLNKIFSFHSLKSDYKSPDGEESPKDGSPENVKNDTFDDAELLNHYVNKDPDYLKSKQLRRQWKTDMHIAKFRKSFSEKGVFVPCQKVLIEERTKVHDTWGPNDFILTVLSGVLGIGNLVIFPHNVAMFGFGPYFTAYMIVTVVVCYPLVFMEMAHGQFCSLGPGACWEYAKLFSFLGFLSPLTYFMYTFVDIYKLLRTSVLLVESTEDGFWDSYLSDRFNGSGLMQSHSLDVDAHTVVSGTKSLDINGTTISIHTVMFFVIMCLLVPRIPTRGKIVSKIVILEFVLFVAYLIYGITLPGALQGIQFAVRTESSKWNNLFDIDMWFFASQEAFFSMCLDTGYYLTFSSYNQFHRKIPEDVFVIVTVNTLYSIFSVFGIFAYLGFVAHFTGYNIKDVAELEHDELLSNTLPAAMSKTDNPIAMTILFLTLVICIFHLNVTGLYEVVVTAVMDFFNLEMRLRKFVALGSVIILYFFTLVTYYAEEVGGIYFIMTNIMSVLERYLTSMMFLVSIGWVFGVNKFIDQTECTVGWATTPVLASKQMKTFWAITWRYVSPSLCLMVILVYIIRVYGHGDRNTQPSWVILILWSSKGVILLLLLGKYLYMVFVESKEYKGVKSKLKYLTQPTDKWGPVLPLKRTIVEVGVQANRIEEEENKTKIKPVTTFKDLGRLKM